MYNTNYIHLYSIKTVKSSKVTLLCLADLPSAKFKGGGGRHDFLGCYIVYIACGIETYVSDETHCSVFIPFS